MRPRTPTLLWIPFVFSIGTISWGLLLAGLVLLATVIIMPAIKDVREAKITRNDYQATLELQEQEIALNKELIAAIKAKDQSLMERLAARQLNLYRKDEEFLVLDASYLNKDHSVGSLVAESLVPTTPKKEPELPGGEMVRGPLVQKLLGLSRPFLLAIACVAMALSFSWG